MSPRRPGWYVVCDAYQRGPFSEAPVAERELATIDKLGACPLEHRLDFEAPTGVKVRLVKQYSTWAGRQFRQYVRAGTGQRVDVLVRLGRDAGMVGVRSNAQAKADAMLRLAG